MRTTQELKVRWMELDDTVDRVVASREGSREQTRVLEAKIREYQRMLRKLKSTEIEDGWLEGLKKVANGAWEKYQASTEKEAESGK